MADQDDAAQDMEQLHLDNTGDSPTESVEVARDDTSAGSDNGIHGDDDTNDNDTSDDGPSDSDSRSEPVAENPICEKTKALANGFTDLINAIVVTSCQHLPPDTDQITEQQVINYFQNRHLYSCLWRMWKLLEDQLWSDVLTDHFPEFAETAGNVRPVRDLDEEPAWVSMSAGECGTALRVMSNEWANSFSVTFLLLALRGDSRQAFPQFGGRMQRASNLVSPSNIASKRDGINRMFASLLCLTDLVSDLGYLLRHPESRESLDSLASIQEERVHVLDKIVRNAPADLVLVESTQSLLAALPADKQSCSICFVDWEVTTATLVDKHGTLQSKENGTDKGWLRISEEGNRLVLQRGFEHVPLRMECGHVFCAGCVETLLSEDRPLQCPFRDQRYGVGRSGAVTKMVGVKEEYTSQCGEVTAVVLGLQNAGVAVTMSSLRQGLDKEFGSQKHNQE